MERRDLLKAIGASGLFAGFPGLARGAQPLPERLIPEDKGITPEMLAALRARGGRRGFRGGGGGGVGRAGGGGAAGLQGGAEVCDRDAVRGHRGGAVVSAWGWDAGREARGRAAELDG